ncbi:helix-turn-helix domain-containing protein [Candidatus Parcubacteria bacterium]|nr:helix-turn-helix domain-containing protein [Candidatus Parcubacteria bacterium]
MDEILIDEKRYVSSKQAAKITGYAKDYIGQLCREGRVPARLVGRSWYVLETAIQDHRFGAPNVQQKEEPSAVPAALPWTKEPPRYEAILDEPLPTINRIKNDVVEGPVERVPEEAVRAPIDLQNSWKEWFDRVGSSPKGIVEPVIEPVVAHVDPDLERDVEEAWVPEVSKDEEVNIPIHQIYQAPPEELLPHYARNTVTEEPVQDLIEEKSKRRGGGRAVRAIRVSAVVIAVVSASLAAVGSGYLDRFDVSNTQAWAISGIQVYNK